MTLESSATFKLPSPPLGMKSAQLEVFSAEQSFLFRLAQRCNRSVPNSVAAFPETPFFRYVENLSSTNIAEEVGLAYGFTNGKSLGNSELIKELNIATMEAGGIQMRRRTILYSLWSLHNKEFPQEAYSFASVLEKKYMSPKGLNNPKMNKVVNRANHNVGFYRDREFLLDIEAELVPTISGLLGKEKAETFVRYYRLDAFKTSRSFERTGNYPVVSTRVNYMTHTVEMGRATAEFISGLKIGTRRWVEPRSDTPAIVKNEYISNFEEILAEYNKQIEIAKLIQQPEVIATLTPVQRELLEFTTAARLRGQVRTDGLNEFKCKYNWEYPGSYQLDKVLFLERKVFEIAKSRVLITLERLKKISDVLKDSAKTKKLHRTLMDILFDYHADQKSAKDVGDDYGYDPELIRILGNFVSKLSFGGVRKEQVRRVDFERAFGENQLPQELSDTFKIIAQYKGNDEIASEICKLGTIGSGIYPRHIRGLRNFVIQFADLYEKDTGS